MAWEGSTRKQRLPDDWPIRRALVSARAHGLCEAKVHHPACPGVGRECDHVVAGDDHSLDNLQWLSTPCHRAKTSDDKQRWKRQPEPHPGLL